LAHTIQIKADEAVATITLHRPREYNALSHQMAQELMECLSLMEGEDSIRVVILTGGDEVFCAGMDLKEVLRLEESKLEEHFLFFLKLYLHICDFGKPTVAAVSGLALGGGFNMALLCDIIVASETAIFAHPEVKYGFNPFVEPLARRIGLAKARELSLTGEPIGAKEAFQLGMVSAVEPPERFWGKAQAMATMLASRPLQAVQAVKRACDVIPRLDRRAALEYEFEKAVRLFTSRETKQLIDQFFVQRRRRGS